MKLDSPGSRLIFSIVDRCGIVTPLGWFNKPNPWAWALYLLGWLEGQPPHGSRGQWGFDGDRRLWPRSCPLQALDDRTAHHPVLVTFGEETQLFGEMADALAVASLGVGIGQVGTPIAALRAARFLRVGCSFRFRTQTDRRQRGVVTEEDDPDPTSTLGVRGDMEYRRGFLGSFCRDAGELDHLGPFRCVFGDQPSEIGGRARKYRCTQSDAVPGTLIEARDEITYDRDCRVIGPNALWWTPPTGAVRRPLMYSIEEGMAPNITCICPPKQVHQRGTEPAMRHVHQVHAGNHLKWKK